MIAEELRIRVVAETQQAERRLNNLTSQTDSAAGAGGNLTTIMGKAKVAIAAAGVAAAAAGAAYMAHLVRQGMAAADEQAKLARQLGMTNEQLAVMQRAAQLSGMSSRQLTTNVDRLNRRLGEAHTNGGRAADALDDLGLSTRDLMNLGPDQQMELLADALAGVQDEFERTRIATDLFGRSGGQMLDFLDNASDNLDRARDEVDRFGLALSETDTRVIEDINDDFSTMGAAVEGAAMQLAVAFSPALEVAANLVTNLATAIGGWAERMSEAVRWTNRLADAQEVLEAVEDGRSVKLTRLQQAIKTTRAEEERLSDVIGDTEQKLEDLRAGETRRYLTQKDRNSLEQTYIGQLGRYQEKLDETSKQLKGLEEEERNLLQEKQKGADAAEESTEATLDGIREEETALERLERELDRIAAFRRAGLMTELEELQAKERARTQYLEALQAEGENIQLVASGNIAAVLRLRDQIAELQEEMRETATTPVSELMEEAADALEERLRQVDELHEQGIIDEEDHLRQRRDAYQRFIDSIHNLGESIEGFDEVEIIKDLNQEIKDLADTANEAAESGAAALSRVSREVQETQREKIAALREEIAERERLERADQRVRDRFDRMVEGNIDAIHRQRDEFIAAGVDEADAATWATGQIVKEYARMAQDIMGHISHVTNAFSALMRQLDRESEQQEERELARINDELDALKERHEAKLEFAEAEGASDTELQRLREELKEKEAEAQEEADEKEREIKRRQFKREQESRARQAAMAGAQAVVNALASIPFPASLGAAALIGTMYLDKVQSIRREEPPAFERGGSFVTSGEQLIKVGDGQSPRERVTVEPLTGPYRRSEGSDITINVNGVIAGRFEDVAYHVHKGIQRAKERGLIKD